jgi:hypothetical protein
MAAKIKFIAKRSLVAGYSVDTQYTIDLKIRYAGMAKGRQPVLSARTSFGGNRETYYFRGDTTWNIGTIALDATDQALMKMILDSVEDGQIFQFADDGTTFVNAVLSSQGYEFTRDPLLDSRASVSFSLVSHP